MSEKYQGSIDRKNDESQRGLKNIEKQIPQKGDDNQEAEVPIRAKTLMRRLPGLGKLAGSRTGPRGLPLYDGWEVPCEVKWCWVSWSGWKQ